MRKTWDFDSKYGTFRKAGSEEDIEDFQTNVNFMSAEMGLSKRKTHDYIFEYGVEKWFQEQKESNSFSPGSTGWEYYITRKVAKEEADKEQTFHTWYQLLGKWGKDRFVAWTEENKFSPEKVAEFLELHESDAFKNFDKPMTKKGFYQEWLEENLPVERGYVTPKEVRQDAESQGVVASETAWDNLDKTAERCKFKRGSRLWGNPQLPIVEPIVVSDNPTIRQ